VVGGGGGSALFGLLVCVSLSFFCNLERKRKWRLHWRLK